MTIENPASASSRSEAPQHTTTELVWPGKTRTIERVALPFQIAETINQSRATREQSPILAQGAAAPLPDEWTNKLVWGDNKYILASLLNGDDSIGLEPLAGKVDLIYIDPPFATGQDFSYKVQVGDESWEKEPNFLEEKAYRDTWGQGMASYLQMMYERLVLARELLSETGSIYLHCDPTANAYLRCLQDSVFGTDNFRNEIVWCYRGMPAGARKWQSKHDTILFYTKSADYTFKVLYGEVTEGTRRTYESAMRRGYNANNSRMMVLIFDEQKYRAAVRAGKIPSGMRESYYEEQGPPLRSWWDDIKILGGPQNKERLDYPTQKPEALLERIITASSNEGDLVLDFFAGAGTTLAVAEKLGRRWIGCDLSRYSIQVTRKRMLDIEGCRPFQLLNLGRYERQHWQVNVLNGHEAPEYAVAEYYRFILGLYHAEAVGGHAHLHGRKAGRMTHVGPADAPVTRDEVTGAVRECEANRYTALDVLGWEWEHGLHDTVRDDAKAHGVDLRLLVIPREVMDSRAVERGDVRFHELAYLKAAPEVTGPQVVVRLDDFIIPSPELVPDDVRAKIKRWSDYVDFWAVDWNFGASGARDTFHNEWQTYRTRGEPALRLVSDPHVYPAPGTYKILVKVIDIFGNDTTQLHEVNVA